MDLKNGIDTVRIALKQFMTGALNICKIKKQGVIGVLLYPKIDVN
jgi:hypothetical protein